MTSGYVRAAGGATARPRLPASPSPAPPPPQSAGDDYFQLALNIKSILTVINTQYYNSGTMNGCASFVPQAASPGLRGVMTWSINWDASSGCNFADTVAPPQGG